MNKWLGFEFQGGGYVTEDFKDFAKDFKRNLKRQLSDDLELVSFNKAHFYLSGFVLNKSTGYYAYFSISDVRYFHNEWHDNILYRTAESDEDFSGGSNRYTTFTNLADSLFNITT